MRLIIKSDHWSLWIFANPKTRAFMYYTANSDRFFWWTSFLPTAFNLTKSTTQLCVWLMPVLDLVSLELGYSFDLFVGLLLHVNPEFFVNIGRESLNCDVRSNVMIIVFQDLVLWVVNLEGTKQSADNNNIVLWILELLIGCGSSIIWAFSGCILSISIWIFGVNDGNLSVIRASSVV